MSQNTVSTEGNAFSFTVENGLTYLTLELPTIDEIECYPINNFAP
jgi:hypothetical protein